MTKMIVMVCNDMYILFNKILVSVFLITSPLQNSPLTVSPLTRMIRVTWNVYTMTERICPTKHVSTLSVPLPK